MHLHCTIKELLTHSKMTQRQLKYYQATRLVNSLTTIINFMALPSFKQFVAARRTVKHAKANISSLFQLSDSLCTTSFSKKSMNLMLTKFLPTEGNSRLLNPACALAQ